MEKHPQPHKKKEILRVVAILLAESRIDPHRPRSWQNHLGLDIPPKKLLEVMAVATTARERAGNVRLLLIAGEIAVNNMTSTGANIITSTAQQESEADPLRLAAILGDAKGPIEGVAIRIDPEQDRPSTYAVTNRLGMIEATVTGLTAQLVLGTPVAEA
jgi:hypothetical protein